mmetsp:Transcript_14740/g.29858  ORF Transcript_14740/g.29858 Transcript_14740/m.29858 type:complete len:91 (+) Transcript_14740:541-813(+)|eukprot:CAMPEP_0167778448 /NCGR_PEP_ID=MMETSP0111_2-20121227/4258_1 /TAXON_ID=91324 /ORGANISM="Lotharella globosa, Strain CCCM811" /LENGTH=90 /DNA_ID=CAMNT_0007668751 /DNA_START=434 /DNA_END=706 /DNA_ORIENTATION=+
MDEAEDIDREAVVATEQDEVEMLLLYSVPMLRLPFSLDAEIFWDSQKLTQQSTFQMIFQQDLALGFNEHVRSFPFSRSQPRPLESNTPFI